MGSVRLEIAVFGPADSVPADSTYRDALEVGSLLARAGFTVVTGGYGGVMEAASRGAHEGAGHVVGVVCDIFRGREPNAYLDEIVHTADLHERQRALIERAAGYVVLPGKAGTLAELTLLWALKRAGCLGDKAVVLLGQRWEPLWHHLRAGGFLERPQLEMTRIVHTPAAALDALRPPTGPTREATA